MSRVNVDDEADNDPRFARLGTGLGAPKAWALECGLARAIRLWRYATSRGVDRLPAAEVAWCLGAGRPRDRYVDALVAAELGDRLDDGSIRLRGGGRLLWKAMNRHSAHAGGAARAASAARDEHGRMLSSRADDSSRPPAEPASDPWVQRSSAPALPPALPPVPEKEGEEEAGSPTPLKLEAPEPGRNGGGRRASSAGAGRQRRNGKNGDHKPLPFTIAALLDTMGEASAGRVLVSQFQANPGKWAKKLTEVIRECEAAGAGLDQVRRAGALMAGWRRTRDLGWLAAPGELVKLIQDVERGATGRNGDGHYQD